MDIDKNYRGLLQFYRQICVEDLREITERVRHYKLSPINMKFVKQKTRGCCNDRNLESGCITEEERVGKASLLSHGLLL
jgi:hypothetical protein